MKTILTSVCALAIAIGAHAQINYQSTYTGVVQLINLHQSGYKYQVANNVAGTITLYNTNHSLWKTITVPTQTIPINTIAFVSENLFDTDNQIEYAVFTFTNSSNSPTATPYFYSKVQVYKETGSLLFSRDSANLTSGAVNSPFGNINGVLDDGTGTKLKLGIFTFNGASPIIQRYEIYSLPGTIPCISCSTQSPSTTGLSKNELSNSGSTVFYPNPASDLIKLNYSLPADAKKAFIRIQDAQGKVVDSYQVTSDFSDLLIPATYQNGLYLYTLEVDGKVIKTDKIIVNK